jgi:hypothetical protein
MLMLTMLDIDEELSLADKSSPSKLQRQQESSEMHRVKVASIFGA